MENNGNASLVRDDSEFDVKGAVRYRSVGPRVERRDGVWHISWEADGPYVLKIRNVPDDFANFGAALGRP